MLLHSIPTVHFNRYAIPVLIFLYISYGISKKSRSNPWWNQIKSLYEFLILAKKIWNSEKKKTYLASNPTQIQVHHNQSLLSKVESEIEQAIQNNRLQHPEGQDYWRVPMIQSWIYFGYFDLLVVLQFKSIINHKLKMKIFK